MRFIDFLNEMGFNQSFIKSRASQLSKQILRHIIKLKFFYDKIDHNHHVSDINTWIDKIQKMTLDGKTRLKPEHYFESIFREHIKTENDIKKIYKQILEKGYKPTRKDGFDEFCVEMFNAFIKISEDISKNNFETIEDYFTFGD
jgi:hypothetical protein